MVALGHVWMAPCWQGLFSRLQRWSVQPCVRPVSAAHETAGHNALRGSGPNQKLAFDNASLNAPDVPEGSLSIDRGCRRRVRFSFVFP